MRKLGLDLGNKSLGIALSDESGIIASPKENYFFPAFNYKMAVEKVMQYLKEYEIDTIVLGYPVSMNNQKSAQTHEVEKFKQLLHIATNVLVVLQDERNSTKSALSSMRDNNVSHKKQKEKKDTVAAAIILQRYLDKQ